MYIHLELTLNTSRRGGDMTDWLDDCVANRKAHAEDVERKQGRLIARGKLIAANASKLWDQFVSSIEHCVSRYNGNFEDEAEHLSMETSPESDGGTHGLRVARKRLPMLSFDLEYRPAARRMAYQFQKNFGGAKPEPHGPRVGLELDLDDGGDLFFRDKDGIVSLPKLCETLLSPLTNHQAYWRAQEKGSLP